MAYSLIAGVPLLVSYMKSALVSNEKQKPFKTPESILPPVPSYFPSTVCRYPLSIMNEPLPLSHTQRKIHLYSGRKMESI